jgi:hypothetical protein
MITSDKTAGNETSLKISGENQCSECLLSHNAVSSHALLKYNLNKQDYEAYIKAFALLAPKDGKLSIKQRCYISSLAALFACPECICDVEQLCLNPQNIDILHWQNSLDTEDKKYAWALDAAVFLGLDKTFSLNKNDSLEQALKKIGLYDIHDFIAAAIQMVRAETHTEFLEVIKQVDDYCKDWKHVVEFNVSIQNNIFTDLLRKIRDYINDAYHIKYAFLYEIAFTKYLELSSYRVKNVFNNTMKDKFQYKFIMFFMSNALNNQIRDKKRSIKLFKKSSDTLKEADSFFHLFGMKSREFEYTPQSFKEIAFEKSTSSVDLKNSYKSSCNFIQKHINNFIDTLVFFERQVQYIEQGNLFKVTASEQFHENISKYKQDGSNIVTDTELDKLNRYCQEWQYERQIVTYFTRSSYYEENLAYLRNMLRENHIHAYTVKYHLLRDNSWYLKDPAKCGPLKKTYLRKLLIKFACKYLNKTIRYLLQFSLKILKRQTIELVEESKTISDTANLCFRALNMERIEFYYNTPYVNEYGLDSSLSNENWKYNYELINYLLRNICNRCIENFERRWAQLPGA